MPALSLKNNESTVESLRKYFGGELHLKEKIGFMMKRIMFALFDQRKRRRRKEVIEKKKKRRGGKRKRKEKKRKRSRQVESELPQILLREVLVLHQ